MIKTNSFSKIFTITLIVRTLGALGVTLLISSCGGQKTQPQTLGDIDKFVRESNKGQSKITQKSTDDVKRAYYDYISGAAKDDRFRVQAATRIAELELSLAGTKSIDDQKNEFDRTVRNTIRLLEETLRDFPDAEGNDHTLYQLAKAYDQVAESEKAIAALEKLVNLYISSDYYVEAKFRIAENAFINGHYFKSEDAYTDVLRNASSDVFFEKALFKRGWARYKQELYADALDDFYDAVLRHQFVEYDALPGAEKELFDEYFRAIGLTFSYMGGVDTIYAYHNEKREPIYVYRTYQTVAELFVKQERYSDAADAYQGYIDHYPNGENAVEAGIGIIRVWKDAGFFNRYIGAFENFYTRYTTESAYWKNSQVKAKEAQSRLATNVIRTNIVLLANYFHNQYLKQGKLTQFQSAQSWYERYLKSYSAYAKQDKVYPLYAELLKKSGNLNRALQYYELAAFDGDIVLDKESAYACVFLTDQLHSQVSEPERSQYLEKHLNYAFLYGQLYPNEAVTASVVQHAVQLASKSGRTQQVIELANILPNKAPIAIGHEVSLLKAQAHFNLFEYEEAELIYQDLMAAKSLNNNERKSVADKLALTLFKEAEHAKNQKKYDLATNYYLRIYHELPSSELTPTAVYDAVALFMENEAWNEAIKYLNVFKRDYPSHNLQQDVSKKLSYAYLKSNRNLEAAREFETLSDFVKNDDEKMAALWQAAQLYYGKNDLDSALRAFKEYAHTYKRPYAENMEAMYNIAEIYQKLGERNKKTFWLRKIIQSDKQAAASIKTDRTTYIAANAAFSLAMLRRDDFSVVALKIPLDRSLKLKKDAMQESVKLFGLAAVYGHAEFVTQSTLAIAQIYQDFAKSLMESERPRNLNSDELEQYNILIEDQAFPFEDKAIEFYETNVSRIANGTYDESVSKSIERLKSLFPARYNRSLKVEKLVQKF